MAKKEEEKKEYKNKVLFLRKSEGGKHLYAFQREGILSGEVESLLINLSELVEFLENPKIKWVKVSAMPKTAEDSATEGGE